MTLKDLIEKDLWIISVGGYGSFPFLGNEKEAEDMRRHKANWEQGVGKKERFGKLKNAIIDDGDGTTSLDNFIERFL